jgi:hypothetical protein
VEVKRQWREADHSPQSSAKVKNQWSCTATSPYASMACAGVHFAPRFLYLKRNNFYFVWNIVLNVGFNGITSALEFQSKTGRLRNRENLLPVCDHVVCVCVCVYIYVYFFFF